MKAERHIRTLHQLRGRSSEVLIEPSSQERLTTHIAGAGVMECFRPGLSGVWMACGNKQRPTVNPMAGPDGTA